MKKRVTRIITILSVLVITLFTAVTPTYAVNVVEVPRHTISQTAHKKIVDWVNANVPNLDIQKYTVITDGSGVIFIYFTPPERDSVVYNGNNSGVFQGQPFSNIFVFDYSTGNYQHSNTYMGTFTISSGGYRVVYSNSTFTSYKCSSSSSCSVDGQRSQPFNMKMSGIFGSTSDAIVGDGEKTRDQIKEVDNTLKDDTVDTSSGGGFFGGFQSDSYGLTSIITSPLNLIKSIVNENCSAVTAPIPYVGKNLSLPCMKPIYQQHFGNLYTFYHTALQGFISYKIAVSIFAMVKGFKDPENDKVEVLDL